jgi:hypothetical protein
MKILKNSVTRGVTLLSVKSDLLSRLDKLMIDLVEKGNEESIADKLSRLICAITCFNIVDRAYFYMFTLPFGFSFYVLALLLLYSHISNN